MLEIKKNRVLINVFENINSYNKFLSDPKNVKPGRDNSSESGSKGFTGTSSYKEAEELLKYGDQDTFEYIKKQQREMNIEKLMGNVINKPKSFNNIVGYQANVPLFLNGVPKNMIDSEKRKTDFKILNIYLDVCASSWVSSNDIRKAGSVYATVIDILEKYGYRINLYAGDVSECNGEKVMSVCRIKTDREPLNLKKMSFPIANPSFLRRIGFKYMEVCNSDNDFTNYCYGRPYTDEQAISMLFKDHLKIDMLVFSYQTGTKFTVKEILKKLEKRGIKVGDQNEKAQ